MGIEIPDSLQWVAKYILGAGDWPDGDETAMRRLGDAWNSMADTLDTVDDDAAAALNAALTAISEGETHTALATYRDTLLAGDEAAFPAIAKYCRYQAELLDDGANDIEHTKLVIIGTMIVAAVEIGVALATAWTGVGAAAGVAARVAAQVAVRIAIKQLIARMLTRGAMKAAARAALHGAFFEALEEGGIDAIARTTQVGKGDRGMDEFGWSDLGLATFAGAVGGAVGGGLGANLDGLSDAATSKLGRFATHTATGTGTELAADLSAQTAAAAITGQDMQIGLDTFTSAGAGGIQSAVESSGRPEAPSTPDLGAPPTAGTDSPDTEADTSPAGSVEPETDGPTTPPNQSSDTGTAPAGNEPPDTNGSTSTQDPSPDLPIGTQNSAVDSPADTRNPPADTATSSVGTPAPGTDPIASTPDATSSTTTPPAESPSDSLVPDSPDDTSAPHPTLSEPTDPRPSPLDAPPPDPSPAPATPTDSAAPPTTVDYSAPADPAPAHTATEPNGPPTTTPSLTSPSPTVTPTSAAPVDTTTAGTSAPSSPTTTPVGTPSTPPHQPPTAPPVSTTTTPASPGTTPEATRTSAHRPTPASGVPAPRPSMLPASTTPAAPPAPSPSASPAAAAPSPTTTISSPHSTLGTSPGPPPQSPQTPTTGHPSDPPSPAQQQSAEVHDRARELRESLRGLPSADGRNPAIDVNRTPSSHRPPPYRLRRFPLDGGQWVAVATIRVYAPDAYPPGSFDIPQAVGEMQATVDSTFNNGGRLLSGDQLLVDVELVATPATADLTMEVNQPAHTTATVLREHLGLPAAGHPLTPQDLREISNDIARTNTDARIDNPSFGRTFAPLHLEDVEHPSYQHYVEDSLRNGNSFDRFADPRVHPYGQLINDGGPGVGGRGNNCVDCSLSALASFHGIPQISAPRYPDPVSGSSQTDPDHPNFLRDGESGELDGDERAESWVGGPWVSFTGMPVPEQYRALHDYIASLGPGASALVGSDWHAVDSNGTRLYEPDGTPMFDGGHATVIVYPLGADGPVWWDPQYGETSSTPPPELMYGAAALEFIPISPEGGPYHAGPGIDSGTGQPLAGRNVRPDEGVSDPGEPLRMGLPPGSDPGAARPLGEGPGQLHDRQTHRSDNDPREPATPGNHGAVRRGDRSGQPPAGTAGVPETTPNSADPDLRGRGDDRVPDPSDLSRRFFTTGHDTTAPDHQDAFPPRAHGPSVGGGGDMGPGPRPADGHLAAGSDLRGVDSSAPLADPADMRGDYVPSDSPDSMEPAAPAVGGDIRLDTGDHVYFDTDCTTVGYDAATESNRQRIARLDGYHDVIVHGTNTGFFIPGRTNEAGRTIHLGSVHPSHIAEAIRNHPDYSGQPIRLVSCFTGTVVDEVDGVCAAQQLSNILGVPVRAPTDAVGVRSDRGEGQQPRIRGNGSWRIFLPLLG